MSETHDLVVTYLASVRTNKHEASDSGGDNESNWTSTRGNINMVQMPHIDEREYDFKYAVKDPTYIDENYSEDFESEDEVTIAPTTLSRLDRYCDSRCI